MKVSVFKSNRLFLLMTCLCILLFSSEELFSQTPLGFIVFRGIKNQEPILTETLITPFDVDPLFDPDLDMTQLQSVSGSGAQETAFIAANQWIRVYDINENTSLYPTNPSRTPDELWSETVSAVTDWTNTNTYSPQLDRTSTIYLLPGKRTSNSLSLSDGCSTILYENLSIAGFSAFAITVLGVS